jgi:hypothetical protein
MSWGATVPQIDAPHMVVCWGAVAVVSSGVLAVFWRKQQCAYLTQLLWLPPAGRRPLAEQRPLWLAQEIHQLQLLAVLQQLQPANSAQSSGQTGCLWTLRRLLQRLQQSLSLRVPQMQPRSQRWVLWTS